MKKILLILSTAIILIAACDEKNTSNSNVNAVKESQVSLSFKGTFSESFEYAGEGSTQRLYARFEIKNDTSNSISFSGYLRKNDFEVADPYGMSLKSYRDGKDWYAPFMTAGSSGSPPDIIKVPPQSSARLIVLIPGLPEEQKTKFCLVPIEKPVEICTDRLSVKEVE